MATLPLGLVGINARYMRTTMATTLAQPYVTVAQGKGLTEGHILRRHVLRNSLIPFVVPSVDLGAVLGA